MANASTVSRVASCSPSTASLDACSASVAAPSPRRNMWPSMSTHPTPTSTTRATPSTASTKPATPSAVRTSAIWWKAMSTWSPCISQVCATPWPPAAPPSPSTRYASSNAIHSTSPSSTMATPRASRLPSVPWVCCSKRVCMCAWSCFPTARTPTATPKNTARRNCKSTSTTMRRTSSLSRHACCWKTFRTTPSARQKSSRRWCAPLPLFLT